MSDDPWMAAGVTAASDPRVQKAAVTAAKDPRVQQAAISAAQDPRVQKAAYDHVQENGFPGEETFPGSGIARPSQSQAQHPASQHASEAFPGTEEDNPSNPVENRPVGGFPGSDDGKSGGNKKLTGKYVEKIPWAVRVGHIRGIPIHIHWLWPLLFIVDILNGLRFSDSFLWMLLFFILDLFMFATILLHELSHCVGAHCVGGFATHILLWPLGGLAYVGHGSGPCGDIWTALVGPIIHLPIAAIWAAISYGSYGELYYFQYYDDIKHKFGQNFVFMAFSTQVLLFAFNMFVPAFPLDGGRILASTLIQHYDKNKTALILLWFSVPIGVGLIIWGFVVAQVLVTALLGIWVLYQAFVIWRHRSNKTLDKYPLFLYEGREHSHSTNNNAPNTASNIVPPV